VAEPHELPDPGVGDLLHRLSIDEVFELYLAREPEVRAVEPGYLGQQVLGPLDVVQHLIVDNGRLHVIANDIAVGTVFVLVGDNLRERLAAMLVDLLALQREPHLAGVVGDDCAVLDLGAPDHLILFKTDAVVEGVHFTRETPFLRLRTLDGLPTMVAAFTTDIPSLSDWGEPLLLGPGSIHVAHTTGEFVEKAQLVEAVEIYNSMANKLSANLV